MTHIIAALLILALHLWCKAQRAGSRWQTYPMVVCQVVNR